MRDLDRSVSALCRRAVLRLETSSDRTPPKVTVTESMVSEVLGKQTDHDGGLPGVERLRRWSNMVACRGRHGEQAKDEL